MPPHLRASRELLTFGAFVRSSLRVVIASNNRVDKLLIFEHLAPFPQPTDHSLAERPPSTETSHDLVHFCRGKSPLTWLVGCV